MWLSELPLVAWGSQCAQWHVRPPVRGRSDSESDGPRCEGAGKARDAGNDGTRQQGPRVGGAEPDADAPEFEHRGARRGPLRDPPTPATASAAGPGRQRHDVRRRFPVAGLGRLAQRGTRGPLRRTPTARCPVLSWPRAGGGPGAVHGQVEWSPTWTCFISLKRELHGARLPTAQSQAKCH
jgi:hypothetical protein